MNMLMYTAARILAERRDPKRFTRLMIYKWIVARQQVRRKKAA